MAKRKRMPIQMQQSTSIETDSEFSLSPKDGITAKGPIAWAILGVVVLVLLKKYGIILKEKAHKVIKRKRKRR